MPTTNTDILTIGSDPEFIFMSPLDGRQVPANQYVQNRTGQTFGTDGHSSTAEIRPPHASDPLAHARHIKELFMNYAKKPEFANVYQLEFYPSAPNESIGGHIHLGHPLLNSDGEYWGRRDTKMFELYEKLFGPIPAGERNFSMQWQQLYAHIVGIQKQTAEHLDTFVSFPLMFLEIPQHAIQRKKSGSYGRLLQYRQQQWGIEYRTPPSWIATEKLANGVLATAYAITHDTLNGTYKPQESFTKMRGFNEMFNLHYTDMLKPWLDVVKKDVKGLTLYPKYRSHIDYFLMSASQGRQLFGQEIKTGWQIPYVVIKNITLFTVKELVERITTALTVATTGAVVGFNYVEKGSLDYMIPQIVTNINTCLSRILPSPTQEQQQNQLYLYALNRKRGDKVKISYIYDESMDVERLDRLSKLIKDTAIAFGFTDPLEVQFVCQSMDYGHNYIAKVGLGRRLREQSTFLSEAIIFTCMLYFNNKLYQAYKVNKTTGRRATMPLVPASILKAFRTNLKGKSKLMPSSVVEDSEDAIPVMPTHTRATISGSNRTIETSSDGRGV